MTDSETNTTDARTGTLVLKGHTGDYFVVPQALVEQGKVSAEQRADLERLLAEEDDTQGHAFFVGVVAGLTANALYDVLTSPTTMTSREAWIMAGFNLGPK